MAAAFAAHRAGRAPPARACAPQEAVPRRERRQRQREVRGQRRARPREPPDDRGARAALDDTGGAFHPDVSKWDAWRPEEVSRVLSRVEAPWCVVAGWAIDLFLGGQRREHE